MLIGGTACDIAMTGTGLAFRATKDLDIVLYVEASDAAFAQVPSTKQDLLEHSSWGQTARSSTEATSIWTVA